MNYIYFGACDWLSADQHIFILIDWPPSRADPSILTQFTLLINIDIDTCPLDSMKTRNKENLVISLNVWDRRGFCDVLPILTSRLFFFFFYMYIFSPCKYVWRKSKSIFDSVVRTAWEQSQWPRLAEIIVHFLSSL